MEVHSHTHTPRKKWTHYFWEFFMLFLAVFAGFLAENQREHFVEHNREKQYMEAYAEDLHIDFNTLGFQEPLFDEKVLKIDTLLHFLQKAISSKENDSLYLYFWHASSFYKFFPIDRTMQQFKNSGAMRLIRDETVVNSILDYDRETKFIDIHLQTSLYNNMEELQQLENKIYDFSLIPGWGHGKSRTQLSYPVNGHLLDNATQFLPEYRNKLINAQRDYASQANYLHALKERNQKLMALIQKHYHLKNKDVNSH
jgi:hypothetical protein